MAGNIGSVSITVDADASAVPSQIEKATAAPLAKIGTAMGKALSSSLAAAVDPKAAASALQSGLVSGLQRLSSAAQSTLAPVTALGQNFVSGFNSAAAASSALTGKLGSLGGVARTALNPAITGVQNFVSGFRSTDAALSSFTGKMGALGGVSRTAWNVASTAASAFAPVAQKALSAVASAASATWEAIKRGASAAWDSIAAGMKGTLETAAKITGAGVAAALGVALTKGFGRLEAIDTAQAKLAGLDITGDQLAATMAAATGAVKDTAFGLGEAASAAASFAAAGVPIDGMQRSLSILASTAAVAGTDLTDMGTIFGKVAATGKVNGEVLQQLAERGVPALSLLSKHLGITAEDVSKMVSSGEVDFETFQSAMEAGLGPAAQAMGQSFSGMLANVGAALGRAGAEAQKPIFDSLKILFPGLISLLDQVTAAITPVATLVGEKLAPSMQALSDALSAVSFDVTADGASSFLSALGPLLPVIGLAAGALGPLLSGLPVVGGLFAGLTGPVGLFAGALVAMLAIDPNTLLSGFESLADALPGMLTGLLNGVAAIVPAMAERLAANAPIFIQGILNLVTAVIPALATAIPMLVETFATLIPTLVTTLLGSIPVILAAGLQLFQSLVTALVTAIPLIVSSLVAMLPQVAAALLTALPLIISSALELFTGVIDGIVQATPIIIAAVLDLLPVLIQTLLGMLPDIISSALELFLGVVTAILTAVPIILVALLDMLPQLVSTLIGMIPQLIDAAVQLFVGIVKALPIVLPQIVDALFKLGPKMVETLIQLVPMLIGAGIDLIGGLVSGLWEAAGAVGEALLSIAQDALGGFLEFFGIKSPSRLMAAYGLNVGQGLARGIDSSMSLVTAAMDDLSAAAVAALPPTLVGDVSAEGTSLAPGSGSASSVTNNSTRTVAFEKGAFAIEGADPAKVAQEIVDRAAEEANR